MEAVLKNGVDFVSLLNSIKTTESMKDKPIYIRIRIEILSQIINDDLNLYFFFYIFDLYKNWKSCCESIQIEERIEY